MSDNSTANSSVGPAVNGIFSDDSDLASDIEADLQELSIEAETDGTSSSVFGSSILHSSPFTGSFSSLLSETLLGEESSSIKSPQFQHNYLRAVSLRGVHTHLLNAQLRENCGSPSCIVRLIFSFLLLLIAGILNTNA